MSEGGAVVGLEGAWGSGKSSLLYLVEEELGNLPNHSRASVVRFRPWLIGNRDALLANLFASMTAEIDRVASSDGDYSKVAKSKAKRAASAVRKFASGLGKAGAAVEVVSDLVGFAPGTLLAKGMQAAGELAAGDTSEPGLETLKGSLVKALTELGHRFIVTIDDVDRLEPKEILEVLRLIRSVADFPNVTYLLCYDIGILAHSIEKAAEVEDGRAYLEKIVQLTVAVPKPEPFQLRQWFGDELSQLASPRDQDELSRLREVIDHEGGRQLRTPRSVIRTLDALRFVLPSLQEFNVDLADLVWLLLIKDGNPGLYRWIESYCGTAASLSLGTARVDGAEKLETASALKIAVGADSFEYRVYLFDFLDHLPGVDVELTTDSYEIDLYREVPDNERDAAISRGRLKSPDHYKFFFALSKPSHALAQGDYDAIQMATSEGAEETAKQLLKLYGEAATSSLSKADVLLERMRGASPSNWDKHQVTNFLMALSNVMDETHRRRAADASVLNSVWDRAERSMVVLLTRLTEGERTQALKRMFRDGHAISWLTALLRREIWAHGRFGDRRRHQESWYFSENNLNRIIKQMTKRYRDMPASEVLKIVDPLNMFFAWLESGDETGPRQLMASCIRTNLGLIDTLEKLTSYTVSTRDRYDVLQRRALEPFLDYSKARRRVETLQKDRNSVISKRAKTLARAFSDAER